MNDSLFTLHHGDLAATVARALKRFRVALAAAVARTDEGAAEPIWVDGMPSRARRIAATVRGVHRRSAVLDEWAMWRQ